MLNKYKLIASLLVLLIFYNPVYSQCTITGQNNGKLIHAENGVDTTINAQAITVIYALPGQAFNEVFQLSIPQDTLIDYQGTTYNATISNMKLDSVVNLPPGSAHTCNPSCTFNGNSIGCVQVSGIVTVPDTGFYKLYINTTSNLLINTGFVTVPYSYTSVDSSYAFIIKENSSNANPLNVQERLNVGETPLAIYNSDSSLLDSLYGKTYDGGLIFYLDTLTGYGFVAAPDDQSAGTSWGCHGTQINGAEGIAVGTGAINSFDIITGCSTSGIAADICINLVNAYDDWFLPSKDELSLMYTNLYASGLDSFNNNYYWSSKEANDNFAWVHDFSNGSQTTQGKTNSLNVRACRYFGLQEVAISQGDTTICYGDSLILVVTGASDSLKWSSGHSGSPIHVAPAQSTTYYVSIYNGWAGRIDSVHLNVELLIADFSADKTSSSCLPFTVNFSDSSVSGIVSWNWDFGDGATSAMSDPTHVYTTAGSYTVGLTVVNANACSNAVVKDSLIQVSSAALGVVGSISGADSVCAGDTVTYSVGSLINADTYVWTVDSGHTIIGVSDSNSISVLWGGSALGNICIYAVSNCDTSDTSCLMVYEKCLPTSIKELESFGDIIIYPNPFSEILNIEFNRKNNKPYSYFIYDLLGNKVRQQENILVNKLSINKAELNNGVYFIELKSGGQSINRKIIVE